MTTAQQMAKEFVIEARRAHLSEGEILRSLQLLVEQWRELLPTVANAYAGEARKIEEEHGK